MVADYFPPLSHNDPRSLPTNIVGHVLSRFLSAGSGLQRPKRPVTPYPGRFCRELLCFEDFTAQPCLQAQENKEFASKIGVGVPLKGALHELNSFDEMASISWQLEALL